MNLIQRLPGWFDPVPPEHRDLAPAFDAQTRADLWDLVTPLSLVGAIVFLPMVAQDYLLYPGVLGPLTVLRVCLVAAFLLTAAIGHWRRGRGSVYHIVFGGQVIVYVIVGLALMVNRDPTGPYWAFFFLMITIIGILPWPTIWVIRTDLTCVVVYVIAASLSGGLDDPARFLLYAFYLVFALLSFAVVSRLLADLRWGSLLNRLQVQKLNDLLQEKLDTQTRLYRQLGEEKKRSDDLLHVVIPIGVALSAEQDFDHLLERIVLEARAFCNADAGTLYLRTEDDRLEFVVVRNDSLDIAMGGTSDHEVSLPPLYLYDEATGEPNRQNIATYAALCGDSVNVPDAYQTEDFDFSGTREFDARIGYRSTSFLTIPLKNSRDRVIGVLQLINAEDSETGQVIPFDKGLQQIVESMSLLATAALEAYIREQSLRQEIRQLRIELDEARRDRQVAEITETEYFQQLRNRARELRDRS